MRSRPKFWLVVCLLCLAGAWFFWQQGNRWAAQPTAVAHAKPAAVTTSMATVKSASTAPVLFSSHNAATNRIAKTNEFAYRLSNTKKTIGELMNHPHAILLDNALIDTDARLDFSIPKNLQASDDPGSYLVQSRGPLDNAFRAMLAAAGAQIISYIPNNAYLVEISAMGAATVKGSPMVQAVIPNAPYYKISSSLFDATGETKDLSADTVLTLGLFTDVAPQTVKQIEKLGGVIVGTDSSPFGPVIRVQAPENWTALAALPGVEIVEAAHRRAEANDLSRVTLGISTNTVTQTNYMGLNGKNVMVEVNDTGIDANHPDFSANGNAISGPAGSTRVFGDSPLSLVDTNGHGTHVAGIIAGNGSKSINPFNVGAAAQGSVTNADFRGKAPLADLYSVAFLDANGNSFDVPDAYLQAAAANTNALISNNSWVNIDDTAYDLAAASYDAAVRDALPGMIGSQPVLFVFAAGNGGGGNDNGSGGDSDTINSPGTAKNVITVGALEELRNITNVVTDINGVSNAIWETQSDSSSQVANYSSRGNVGIGTEGTAGRFKPDVVAPGSFVVSTRSTEWDEAAYYNPTNYYFQTLPDQFIETNSENTYNLSLSFLPPDITFNSNIVSITIQLVPNINSPTNFPVLPIFVSHTNYPAPPSNNGDFESTSNEVSIPPDGSSSYLSEIEGGNLYYTIVNTNSERVGYDIDIEITTTNEFGNYFTVLSNLNDTLGPYYRYESGTSMSTPAVSGVLALMQDYFTNTLGLKPSPALLKAMLINGSRPIGNYDYAINGGLNLEGWGLPSLPDSLPDGLTNQINAPSSAFFLDQNPTTALATGDSQTFLVTVDPTSFGQAFPLEVTLAWTDPPGNPAAAIKLVNNLELVITNLDTGDVYFGNDFTSGNTFNEPWNTNSAAAPNLDSINNVENIIIPPLLAGSYSVTVIGRSVNVNAVTAQTNNAAGAYAPNVVQDYALVIACGEGEVANAIKVTPALVGNGGLVSNPTSDQRITGVGIDSTGVATNGQNGIFFDQLAGANSPLLGTNTLSFTSPNSPYATNSALTVGQTNQWHFYVVTNNTTFTNAAFVTFLPDTLSIPRIGVFADSDANSTRPEADIDLYVSTSPSLTNLDPTVISNCINGVQQVGETVGGIFNGASLGRGGTEFVVDTNSFPVPGEVYYVGVKSEDQQAAEYGFLPVFSQLPFSQSGPNGTEQVNGVELPVTIPDGSPAHPGIGYIFGLALQPIEVQDVTVSDTITHQNFGDLIGTLQHNDISVVLNNHDSLGNPPGPYNFLYDDGPAPVIGSQAPDGPGTLQSYQGQQGMGPWILTEVDDSLTQTGRVDNFQLTIQPHQDLGKGIDELVPAQGWAYGFVDVPAGYTNLTIAATNISLEILGTQPASPPLELFVKFGSVPTLADTNDVVYLTNSFTRLSYPNADPGNLISTGPYLTPGRYFVGIYNPSTVPQEAYVIATLNFSEAAISTVDYDSSDAVPILDDAVTTTSLHVTNTDIIQSLNIGLRVDHPRISDLVFHLIAPDGTRYLLMENRGGTTTNGAGATIGMTIITTNATSQNIEELPAADYPVGPIADGWSVMKNQVSVVTDPANTFQSGNFLALANGTISNTLPTVAGQTYTLTFAYRGPGIVSLWRGQGNANDDINANNGTLIGTYGSGEVGSAFILDGTTGYIKVPASSSLNVGPGDGFTFDAWIDPSNLNSQTIAEWNDNAGNIGAHFYVSESESGPGPVGCLYANLYNGGDHIISTGAGVVTTNSYQHVALTYNKTSGTAVIYRNGVAVQTESWGSFTPRTAYDFYLGTRPNGYDTGQNFDGGIDEASLYQRVLSPSEIKAIFQNGSAGKYNIITTTFPQNLAEATMNLQGNSLIIPFGANTNWQIYTNTFTATQNGTPLQITGLEPGMLLTAMSLTPQANVQYEYLTFTEDTNLTTTPIKYAVPPFVQVVATGWTQWNGNGHWYKAVLTNGLTWDQSDQIAHNEGGYLATITSAAENDFVFSLIDSPSFFGNWFGGGDGPAIGGVQTNGAIEPAGGWTWETGEPWVYTNWLAGQPDNNAASSGNENRLYYWSSTTGTPANTWNDFPENQSLSPSSYVVERDSGFGLYYLPEQDISALDGQSAFGTWQLEIQDDRAGAGLTNSLVSWQLQFTFATTNFVIPTAPIALTNTTPETNVVSSNSITWYSVYVPLNADIATNRLISASAPVNLLFNQTAPDTNGASTLLENVPSGSTNLSTMTAPQLMPGMTYYLGIQNTNDFDVTNVVLEVDFHFLAAGAPFAFTQPATLVTGASAQLNGFATPNGFPATAWFQWGTTTNYGSNTPPASVGTLLNVVYTNSQISGLVKNVPYHFRLVVSNALAVTYGFDQILDEANVVAWGANYVGQLDVPAGLSNVTAIAGAYDHSLAIKTNALIAVWGDNTFGQATVPPSLTNAMTLVVAGGQYYTTALQTNGTVAAWGANILNATNVPPGLSNVVTIAGGTYSSLALKNDGTIVEWGAPFFNLGTNAPADATNIVAISSGTYHNLALKNDGTIIAWGDDSYGQTNVPADLTNVVAIAAGGYHSLALKNDRTVVAWGDDSSGQTNVPVGLSNVVAIAAGGFHSLALKTDGSIVAWGDDTAGQTNVPAGLSNFVALTAGYLHSLALTPQSGINLTNVSGTNPSNGVPVMNGILPGGVTYYQVVVPLNVDFATNILLNASGPLNVWFSTNTPPTIGAANDTLLLAGVTNDAYVLSTNGSPLLIPGSTYYLGIQNTNSFTVAYGIQVDFHFMIATNPSVSISSITQTNNGTTNGFLLKWFAPTNDIFQVQFTTNLAPADWLTFSNIITYTGSLTPTNGLFTFFDDGSQFPFGATRFYRLILLSSLNNGAPQTSTVSSSGINYFSITVPANADFATNLLLSASAPVNLLFNQTATPTGTNAGDFTLLTNSTGSISILGLSTTPPLVPGSTYFLGVQNTNSLPVNFSLKVDFHLLTATSAPVSISGIISTNNGGGTNGFLLTWFAPTNDIFQVQFTTNLAPADWLTFTNIISYDVLMSPTNSQFNFFDDGSQFPFGATRFYRLMLYGSSPAFSAPTISSVFINTNGVNLQWSGSSGEGFKVQWKTNLAPIVNWNTFSGIVTSPNTSFNYLDDGTQSGGLDGVKFYRLMVFP